MKNDRRDFIKTAGLAGLSGFMLPVLAQQADELPAGDGAVGALVFIFLVLLVLELLGAINIFPGIRSAN